MKIDDFKHLREGIFEDLKLSLDYYLYGQGAVEKADLPGTPQHWIQQVLDEPVLTDLLDKYLELEFARFMKLYGATRVHQDLLEKFLSIIESVHNFRLPPLLAVLKEYQAVAKEEVKVFQEFQKQADQVPADGHDDDEEDFLDQPDVQFEGKTLQDMEIQTFEDVELVDEDLDWIDETVRSILEQLGIEDSFDDLMNEVYGTQDDGTFANDINELLSSAFGLDDLGAA